MVTFRIISLSTQNTSYVIHILLDGKYYAVLEKCAIVYKIMKIKCNVEEEEFNTLLDKYKFGFYGPKETVESLLQELECLIIAKKLAI